MTSHSPNRIRSAFTLVELLVVIGVVAVLFSLLMPSLQIAREQAKLVQDLSSIRQCAVVAIGMYAADYSGAIPPLVGRREGFPGTGASIWSGGGYAVPLTDPLPSDPSVSCNVGWPDFLQMYLEPKNQRSDPNFREYSGVMYCAGDFPGMGGGFTPLSSRPGWWGNLFYREWSWRMNPNVTTVVASGLPWPNGKAVYGTKVTNIKGSGRKILFAEAHYEGVNGATWWSPMAMAPFINGQLLSPNTIERWAPLDRFSVPRHRNGCVIAYCDGSARVIGWKERDRLMTLQPDDWDLKRP